MIYEYPKYKSPPNQALGVLAGMLIGVLVGVVAMLLLARVRGNPKEVEMGVKNYEQLEHISDAA